MEQNKDYLMHYGRLGMKWGVMNGPPYPIGTERVRKLRERRKKLKEKERIAKLKTENAMIKKSIRDERRKQILAEKQAKRDDGQIEETNARLNSKKKSLFQMSDKEISDLHTRTTKEKQIRENQLSSIANGSTFVKALILSAGTIMLKKAVEGVASAKGAEYAENYVKAAKNRAIKQVRRQEKRKENWQKFTKGVIGVFNTNPST